MERIKILLNDAEFTALVRLSELELRPIPDEARAIIRERLRLEGFLPEQRQEVANAAG